MTRMETRYEHIVLDDGGVPLIAGTTMKVVELIVAQTAYSWSSEELHFQFPFLTLGQIYSSLAYYWEHQGELDADIARRLEVTEKCQHQSPPSRLRERLRAQDRI